MNLYAQMVLPHSVQFISIKSLAIGNRIRCGIENVLKTKMLIFHIFGVICFDSFHGIQASISIAGLFQTGFNPLRRTLLDLSWRKLEGKNHNHGFSYEGN